MARARRVTRGGTNLCRARGSVVEQNGITARAETRTERGGWGLRGARGSKVDARGEHGAGNRRPHVPTPFRPRSAPPP